MSEDTGHDKAPEPPGRDSERPVLVVGIGASAGGLAAFKEFVSHTPADTGMGFVLLPHLDPSHKSVMSELLAEQTPMPVTEAAEDMLVEPNHVYVVPAGHGLSIERGRLHLQPLEDPHYRWTLVDQFFRALAADQLERAVAIILSGTGRHGILGIREVKLQGGLVVAQTPQSSEYQQMPESAIHTGMVDLILTPAEMPKALSEYAGHSYLLDRGANPNIGEFIEPILATVRKRARLDFRSYRPNMLTRRIFRRMSLSHMHSLQQYHRHLQQTPEETDALARDLLIGVTAFFRDPEAFEELAQQVLPDLLADFNVERPLRIWVPACSTGEEAYSLAILVHEACAAAKRPVDLQIFASDIDEAALAQARRGIYPVNIVNDVSEKRLDTYFVKIENDGYRVSQRLRDSVVFAAQNLIGDAPYSQLDLISCRNLLIYLQPEMQAKVIQLFHFALRSKGYLFLGPSESIAKAGDLFVPVSKKWRLFRALVGNGRTLLDIPITGSSSYRRSTSVEPEAAGTRTRLNHVADLTAKMLLSDYAPASVLIDRNFQILHFYGPTSEYLELPSGEPTKDLMAMLRQGLSSRVRGVARRAWSVSNMVVDSDAKLKRDGHYISCIITARPVVNAGAANGLLLLSFEDSEPGSAVDSGKKSNETITSDATVVEELEYELKSTRHDLQNNVEELADSNEQLKVSNEEMMSVNEELQSANEELETSKEELQSMNEELNTVNSELQSKLMELEASNDDIKNLLSSTDIATLFLDRSLRIKLFNPPLGELMNLRNTDVDRPISDISGRVDNTDFSRDAKQVLARLAPVERVVTSETEGGERAYLRRVVPYRTGSDQIGGVVVTFVDITTRYTIEKQLEHRVRERTVALRKSNNQLSLVLRAAGAAVWGMEATEHRSLVWRNAHAEMFGELPRPGEDAWAWWLARVHPEDREQVEGSLQEAIQGDEGRWQAEYRFRVADDENYHWVSDIAHLSRDRAGRFRFANGAMVDIHDRRLAELKVIDRSERLTAIMDHTAEAIIVFNKQGIIENVNRAVEVMLGYSPDELLGQDILEIEAVKFRRTRQEETDASHVVGPFSALDHQSQFIAQHKDGSTFVVESRLNEIVGLDLLMTILTSLKERHALEREIVGISTWEQERTGRELHDGLGQRLTGLNMMVSHLANSLEHRQSPDAALMSEITTQLQQAAAEVNRISHGLAPISISPDGLADALASLVEQVDPTTEIDCNFEGDLGIVIGDQQDANQLFRIGQEAFNNALKYAEASTITVRLTSVAGGVELAVIDDGVGFDLKSMLEKDGMGVRIMQYRATTAGTVLSIDTAPGKGTRVYCSLQNQGLPDSG